MYPTECISRYINAPGEFFHLINDSSQGMNFYVQHSERVKQIKALLESIKGKGISQQLSQEIRML